MEFNLDQYKNDLLFLPLGGAGEIGMNLNLYHLNGKWLMVDLGAGFADEYLPGADVIVPNINFIRKHRKNLLGIVLTHAHEDHLGAIPYLWDELRVPIYATPFTANVLKVKISEFGFSEKIDIKEVAIASQLEIGPFKIDMVPLTHSAPEMQALAIHTPQGTVFHTGDWKFDPEPVVGKSSNLDLLKEYGDKGILAFVGDSTNVFSEGKSGSEGALNDSLSELISSAKGLVVVTTFASNVARMETILKIATQRRKKIIIAGKSMWRIFRAAQESGYLGEYRNIHDITEFKKFKREDVLVLCTGCQGEPLAAMTKMANKEHPYIRLQKDDSVIFSSKIIPGNEKSIFRLFNMLVDIGAEVLTEKDHFVHVSGHPAKDELKLMYELIRPHLAIPVHGELIHMHEHSKLAKSWGVPNIIEVKNGCVIKISRDESKKVGQVETGFFAVDGNCLISPQSTVMRMRRRIRLEGVIIIVLTVDKKWSFVTKPVINAPGVLDENEDKDIMLMMQKSIGENLTSSINAKNAKITHNEAEQIIRRAVRKIVRTEIGKEPMIQITIQQI